ncbi:hypothetical protein [Sporosarcina sp. Te-1]|uniref:hypothetical protein n=1 Tax=Sporosarcina sp. Te-1 TaxID=2818390 RepID=UPI001A9F533B|nr:hypothetical protein [Sporosarcina sp. Te-1]QTD39890.1 hypothetical protein J3U78_13740 [Sporosarcina sp. Te-1]
MERMPVDPAEMERRRDLDYIASLDMIGEGAPVHYPSDEASVDRRKEAVGFDESELPPAYQ